MTARGSSDWQSTARIRAAAPDVVNHRQRFVPAVDQNLDNLVGQPLLADRGPAVEAAPRDLWVVLRLQFDMKNDAAFKQHDQIGQRLEAIREFHGQIFDNRRQAAQA